VSDEENDRVNRLCELSLLKEVEEAKTSLEALCKSVREVSNSHKAVETLVQCRNPVFHSSGIMPSDMQEGPILPVPDV
jgi:hypothetical protein